MKNTTQKTIWKAVKAIKACISRVSRPFSFKGEVQPMGGTNKEESMKIGKTFQFASLILLAMFLLPSSLYAQSFNTYYVRTDGGTITECNGLYDAPYPGAGVAQNCAVNHIYWLLPIRGNNPHVLAGGDTVIIGPGSYEMGYHGPNIQDGSKCAAPWPYGCYSAPVPSGPDAQNPTRILGKGWDNGCSTPPELWGAEKASYLVNLNGSNNVELRCLDLTDHDSCVLFQGSDACKKGGSYPYGPWASGGINASDSDNVLMENVKIHGFASYGIKAGRISNWELRQVHLRGNGFVGWDGDIGGTGSSNSGYIKFIRSTIEYSGCSETYPVTQGGEAGITNCWSQGQGGYGDGLGTGRTDGDWYFEDVNFSHNVSDGIDLLYANEGSNGTVKVLRGTFEGNAGNQIKTAFNTVIEDAKVIGNCAYFTENGAHPNLVWDGGTSEPGWSGNCRALGNSIAINLNVPGQSVEIINTTITGQGDVLMQTGGDSCNGSEVFDVRNSILVGGNQHYHAGRTALYYAAGENGNGSGPCGQIQPSYTDNIVYNLKNGECPAGSICQDPKFQGVTIGSELVPLDNENFDVHLRQDSPALNQGAVLSGFDPLDNEKFDRGSTWDLGAFEYVYNLCGNSQIDPGESCDSTNQACTSPSGYSGTEYCNSSCTGYGTCISSLFCGDGVCTSSAEDASTCPQDCGSGGGTPPNPVCGNSAVESGEECDDGNTINGDGCSDTCVAEFCGDNIVHPNLEEECDDGNISSGDGCSSTCKVESSNFQIMLSYQSNRSNATVLPGQIDPENVYIFVTPESDIKQARFYLDDNGLSGVPVQTEGYKPFDFAGTASNGTAVPFDAATLLGGSHNITVSITRKDNSIEVIGGDFNINGPANPVCGNSVIELGEECDDGNAVSNDGCSDVCIMEYCGDSVIHSGLGEECDDGNIVSGDGCSISCQTEYCGDSILQSGLNEQCDDGNTASGDGCSDACGLEFCGDGILQSGINEECDDANTVSGDGCSDVCKIEQTSMYKLMLSYSKYRSNAVLLSGDVSQDDIYVFISPETNVKRVEFYMDATAGIDPPIQTEGYKPFDMAGTSGSKANPYDVTQLSSGTHTVTAVVKLKNGTTEVTTATFNVPEAASPPFSVLNAENMSLKTTGGPATGGWNLWSNGKVEESVSFPSAGSFTFDIVAKGHLAGSELPEMNLLIDNNIVATVNVGATQWATFTIPDVLVSPGQHDVAVSFSNDYYDPPNDRNLIVDTISITAN